ncbi:MAG: translation initiation factor IF-5A [Candidatus Altiarchaeota archaeon]|nr:translation initiation factor IF-5A [Candidatus Altiarchaeota archaeon]
METTFEEVVKLRKGRYIVLDGHPCKISNIQTSAPGKHGHAKSRIEGTSLFDKSKHSTVKPSGTRVEVPMIQRRQAQILNVTGSRVQLMDGQNYETFEEDIPAGMEFTPGQEIFYWIVMGKKLLKREDQ